MLSYVIFPAIRNYLLLLSSHRSLWIHYNYHNSLDDPRTDKGKLLDNTISLFKYDANPLPLLPACASLNYGTTIWEGLKCYRNKSGDPIVFRPDRNFYRFANGAVQMCLPPPSRELFLRGVQHILHENSSLIPPHGEGMKLYVRPMLLGSGQQLGKNQCQRLWRFVSNDIANMPLIDLDLTSIPFMLFY